MFEGSEKNRASIGAACALLRQNNVPLQLWVEIHAPTETHVCVFWLI